MSASWQDLKVGALAGPCFPVLQTPPSMLMMSGCMESLIVWFTVLRACLKLPVLPAARAQDHFRKVCTPNYVNVFRDRGGVIGVVEFDTPEDLARAVRAPLLLFHLP